MTNLAGAPTASRMSLVFTYDYQGRRAQKIVSTNKANKYVGAYTNRYAYDGWNCVAVLSPTLAVVESFQWGLDQSGGVQGAGGVGGLVEVTCGTTNCFVAFDGNGNVSALVSAANGAIVATYEYGPFGELIRATGPMAKLNPFRFSTKYDDDESDFLYYGYRFYNPSTGRWLSRDPVDEFGSLQLRQRHSRKRHFPCPLYVFVNNDGVNHIDLFGLDVYLDTHPVAFGENHSFILLEVNCKSLWYNFALFRRALPNGNHYATLGAGPGFLFWGYLINGVDRRKDANLSTVNYSRRIADPAGMSDDYFIEKLVNTHEHYNEQAWYEWFPEMDDDGYNSNSYVSGLLDIVLGISDGYTVVPPPNTPGFKKPVPPSYFP